MYACHWYFANGYELITPRRLFLVGMPGSGKSTLGTFVAGELGWRFVDTDAMVEREAGMTVASLFAIRGELYFRQLEREALCHSLAYPEPVVVATGGGLPCQGDSMNLMLAVGLVLYLRASLGELIMNLREGVQSRPLLAQADSDSALRERLFNLLSKREAFYSKAHVAMPLEEARAFHWRDAVRVIE